MNTSDRCQIKLVQDALGELRGGQCVTDTVEGSTLQGSITVVWCVGSNSNLYAMLILVPKTIFVSGGRAGIFLVRGEAVLLMNFSLIKRIYSNVDSIRDYYLDPIKFQLFPQLP